LNSCVVCRAVVESYRDGLRPPAIHIRICEADADVTFRFAKLIIFDSVLCSCASSEWSTSQPLHMMFPACSAAVFHRCKWHGNCAYHAWPIQATMMHTGVVSSGSALSEAVLFAGYQIREEAFWQRISAKCGSMATQRLIIKTAAHSPAHQIRTLPGELSLGPSTGWGVLGLGCPCLDCTLNTLVSSWSQSPNGYNHGFQRSWPPKKPPDTQ